LSSLKNTNKPDVTPVASYEIFPNVDIWANTYDLFRFSERPGERPPDVCALGFAFWMMFTSLSLIRLRILGWIVLLCDLWSRMAITSCHIT